MRILFTFVGGHGHFEPLAPIARAAAAAGHVVAFGCAPSMAAAVEAAGFRALPMGPSRGGPPARLPLRPPDRAREERDLRERFARRAARARAPLTLALCDDWRPDLLVCDETDFGAMIAAERLGLPLATVLVIAAGSFVRSEVVGDALDEVRALHGLPPDPQLRMPERQLVLSPVPPRYRDPVRPLPATVECFRAVDVPPAGARAGGPRPAWASVRAGAPVVYVTLGTIFNLESGDLLARLVAALRELDLNLLVTVGNEIDPAELGPQPSHVHVARWVPQASVLPFCDGVVSHGGSGSVIGALAHGLPSVLIPLGADQPLNAERCAALGVARVLDAVRLTPDGVRTAVESVLADPSVRRNAQRLRDEMAALPDAAHAVRRLEGLARSGC